MSNHEVVYEIARYRDNGDRLVERFELLSDGTAVHRRNSDGSVTPRKGRTVREAIAEDPDLCEIRGGELTRITTTALVDELPLILWAPATMPEDFEDPDEIPYNDFGEAVETYNDREVEVNGRKWSVFDGSVLPVENAWSGPRRVETWAELEFDTGGSPFSDGRSWAAIGLVNPSVVVCIWPNWASDGQVVSVKRRGSDAADVFQWLMRFAPEDWGTGSRLDSNRMIAQLFVETAEGIGERKSVSGTYLAAGITEYAYSFGVGGYWDLTLNLSPDLVTEVLDLIVQDEDLTDIVTARRDPESPAGRARRVALEELS